MELAIDAARLLDRIEALAAVGAIPDTTGCSRLALTDDDRAGRDLVVGWMRDLGLEVTIDGIGNVTAVMASPHGPPVMTGSHIDTVATGGRYDGNLGVLAGLEVIETVLAADIELARPLAVGFFTDEEGARFPPDMLGSLVYVGGLGLEDALHLQALDLLPGRKAAMGCGMTGQDRLQGVILLGQCLIAGQHHHAGHCHHEQARDRPDHDAASS